jgi:putative transposase
MFTFGNGLVLREGARTFQFERELSCFEIQFRYLDNNEVRTFSKTGLYKKILAKTVIPVHQNGHSIAQPNTVPVQDKVYTYSTTLTEKQEQTLGFRNLLVKRAIAHGVTPGSLKRCEAFLESVRQEGDEFFKKYLPYGHGQGVPKLPCADTLRKWMKRHRSSGENPYAQLDLRPLVRRCKRISVQAEEMVEKCISKYYLQKHGLSVAETFRRYLQDAAQEERLLGAKLELASLRSMQRRVNEIDPYIRDLKRYGSEYTRNKWRYSLKGDTSTRVLERVEIDHTWLDMWVLDPVSGVPIGRPWITVAIDRYSGYILGYYVSFYGPSVASVAHCIRNAIFPKEDLLSLVPGLPQPWTAMGIAEQYVVDNGLEFHAKEFLRIMFELRADLLFNPVRRPWLKPSIERTMMEVNRMLPGRGKVYTPTKNMKPMSPSDSAAILFDDLCAGLTLWAADAFPKSIHHKNLVRPLDLWEEGRLTSPIPMFPLGFEQFDITAGMSTQRTVDGDGVFFKYLRFNSVELQDYLRSNGLKRRLDIRVNPDDLGRVYVNLQEEKRWLPVALQKPSDGYGDGLSLIQHEIIRAEAGKRLTRNNSEEELAKAQERLRCQWAEAVTRGVRVRKDGALVKLQGLSSARLSGMKAPKTRGSHDIPVASPVSEGHLKRVMPFKAFSMAEEYS